MITPILATVQRLAGGAIAALTHPATAVLGIGVAALAALAISVGAVHAQEGGDDLQRVFLAARADLAARLGLAEDAISIKRAEPVTWSDACLGAAAPDELCAQVLTDGWVLWLLAGAGDFYRYHADLDGSVVRFAEGLGVDVYYPDLPLPPGATLRIDAPAPASEEAPPDALPTTGSGGLARTSHPDNAGPVWVWGIVGGVLVALAGTNYGFQRRLSPNRTS